MILDISVENIKCGGCANSIRQAVEKISGVHAVEVNIEEGTIHVEGSEAMQKQEIVTKLQQMGYPEPGKGNPLTTVNSFVSCMIGRVS
jgi:copper chaperone